MRSASISSWKMASDSEGLRQKRHSYLIPLAFVENGFRFGRVTTLRLKIFNLTNICVENGFRFGRVTTKKCSLIELIDEVENGFRFGRVTTIFVIFPSPESVAVENGFRFGRVTTAI